MDKIEERDLGEELYDLYKVVEFPCSDEEEISARERIVEIEKTLDINQRKLGSMETVTALSKQDKVVDATKQEYAFSTHCMSCDNGKNYQIDDNIPESCPVCGEHKEYSIVNMNSLKGNFSVSDWYVCNDCSSHDIGVTDAQESICHSCGSLNIIVE